MISFMVPREKREENYAVLSEIFSEVFLKLKNRFNKIAYIINHFGTLIMLYSGGILSANFSE